MSKGAKQGQNRFAEAQDRHRRFRITRIRDDVIPQLIAFTGKVSFDGTTPFSRFCAELYNDDLPINERPIGYRTLVQSTEYWSLLEPIYRKHTSLSKNLDSKKEKFVAKLATQRAEKLTIEIEKLKRENQALRSILRNHGASEITLPRQEQGQNDFLSKFDKTCRALKLVLDASEGMFAVDSDAKKISCAYDDLEPLEGLVPTSIVEPFVLWLLEKGKNHGSQ